MAKRDRQQVAQADQEARVAEEAAQAASTLPGDAGEAGEAGEAEEATELVGDGPLIYAEVAKRAELLAGVESVLVAHAGECGEDEGLVDVAERLSSYWKQTARARESGRLSLLERPDSPWVVTLCGSMKHAADMDKEAVAQTVAGRIVLLPNVDLRRSDDLFRSKVKCKSCNGRPGLVAICNQCEHTGERMEVDEEKKKAMKLQLDALHFEKIAISDEVRFCCPGGYFGESTTREFKRAVDARKYVSFSDAKSAPPWVKTLLEESGYVAEAGAVGAVWKPLPKSE